MKFSKPSMLCTLFLAAVLLPACETMGPQLSEKLPMEPIDSDEIDEEDPTKPVFTELKQPEEDKENKKTKVEYFPGSGRMTGSPRGKVSTGSSGKKGKYTLNFDDADLGEVTKVILGDTLNQNYVLSPKVAGRVTLQTSRPLTRQELIPTLEMLLEMNGAVLVADNGTYKIEPAAKALQGAKSPSVGIPGGRLPNGYQLRVIPLQYVGVAEMQKIVQPLLTAKAVVYSDPARNLIMVSGTSQQLENVLETIRIFDVDAMRGMSVGLFTLQNVDAETVSGELEKLFGETDKGPLTGMFRLIPIERLNALMVITPQKKYLYEAESWISRLDRSASEDGGSGGVHVYRVQNVDAVELADNLTEIFGGESKKSRTPDASLAPGLEASEIGGQDKDKKDRKKKTRSRSGSTASSLSDLGEEVRIIADESNNSIVVVATKQQYGVIKGVIKQLDIMPLQVLIDATIVEVSLIDNLRYGIAWAFQQGDFKGVFSDQNLNAANVRPDSIFTGTRENFNPLNPDVLTNGFSLVFAASGVKAALEALADDNKLNVISSPSLMVLNNQEATIQVGDQVPIRTSESVNTSGVTVQGSDTSGIVASQIQQQETGVTLEVKPRVNAGGLVIMEIKQKVNDVARTDTSGIDSPTIQQREIESSIAVHDGESIVLGGLIREQRERGKTGIPILSRIPLLGPFFGTTEKTLDRTELVIIITPRVVNNKRKARQITNEFKRKLTGIYSDKSIRKRKRKPENDDETMNNSIHQGRSKSDNIQKPTEKEN